MNREVVNREIINIKGTRSGLVICLESEHDFDELKETLKTKIEAARGFFKGAKFTFHLGLNSLPAEKTKELEDICREHGLVPDQEISWPASEQQVLSNQTLPIMREASPSLPVSGVTKDEKKRCLLIKRSLRSGQKYYYDGNVVLLGDLNPGSEITASGDIVVFGVLRGVVHAGAGGEQDSVIMAYRLNPVQLRIASTISRPPENSPVSQHPEIARLQQGRMIIEPYLTYGLKKQ